MFVKWDCSEHCEFVFCFRFEFCSDFRFFFPSIPSEKLSVQDKCQFFTYAMEAAWTSGEWESIARLFQKQNECFQNNAKSFDVSIGTNDLVDSSEYYTR